MLLSGSQNTVELFSSNHIDCVKITRVESINFRFGGGSTAFFSSGTMSSSVWLSAGILVSHLSNKYWNLKINQLNIGGLSNV